MTIFGISIQLIFSFVMVYLLIPVLIYSIIQLVKENGTFYGFLTLICAVVLGVLIWGIFFGYGIISNLNKAEYYIIFTFWLVNLLIYTGTLLIYLVKQNFYKNE